MLKIHYFASVREALDRTEESLELPAGVEDVAGLVSHLAAQNPALQALDNSSNALLVAVNQTVVDRSWKLSEDDEVAFFPPMTGG
jgi:molybdopterin synthase sulfur carrier subunit